MANPADTTNPPAKRKCSVEGCERDLRPPSAKGMCSLHYSRMKKTGTTDKRSVPLKFCAAPDCSSVVIKARLCSFHKQRQDFGRDLAAKKKTPDGEPQRWLTERAQNTGDGCLIWPYARTPKGYGHVVFDGVQGSAHRFMCILAHGEPPKDKPLATHSCGKGHEACVAPWHLSWGTHKSNAQDRAMHGTHCRGEASPNAKLTKAQAINVFMSLDSSRVAALRYGVSEKTAKLIRQRRIWVEATTGLTSPRPIRKKRRA